MDCWEILEITPTADEKAIRRAYAKKLKITRPDEDPVAYQALREAFDEALVLVPYYQEEQENIDERLFLSDHHDERVSVVEDTEKLTDKSVTESREDSTLETLSSATALDISEESNTSDAGENDHESEVFDENEFDEECEEGHFYASALLESEIESLLEHEGEEALVSQWANFYDKLTQLSLDGSDYLSRRIWQLFHQHSIENPFIWQQWSHYFNWHNDYRFVEDYHIDKLNYLQEKIQRAELLSQANTVPILGAICRRLSNKLSRFMTTIYLMLIAPFVEIEKNRYAVQYQRMIETMPKDIFAEARSFRGMLLICGIGVYVIFAKLSGLSFRSSLSLQLADRLVSALATALVLVLSIRILMKIAGWLKILFIETTSLMSKKELIFKGMLPLVLILALIPFMADIANTKSVTMAVSVVLAWSLSATFKEEGKYSYWLFYYIPSVLVGFVLFSYYDITFEEAYLVLVAVALWVNINIFILEFHRYWLDQLKNIVTKGQDSFSSPAYVLKLLVKFLLSVFYWVFFLPYHTNNLYQRTQAKSSFIEIAYYAFFLSLPFLAFVGDHYALFYLLMMVLLILFQYQLKTWVFKRLKIEG